MPRVSSKNQVTLHGGGDVRACGAAGRLRGGHGPRHWRRRTPVIAPRPRAEFGGTPLPLGVHRAREPAPTRGRDDPRHASASCSRSGCRTRADAHHRRAVDRCRTRRRAGERCSRPPVPTARRLVVRSHAAVVWATPARATIASRHRIGSAERSRLPSRRFRNCVLSNANGCACRTRDGPCPRRPRPGGELLTSRPRVSAALAGRRPRQLRSRPAAERLSSRREMTSPPPRHPQGPPGAASCDRARLAAIPPPPPPREGHPSSLGRRMPAEAAGQLNSPSCFRRSVPASHAFGAARESRRGWSWGREVDGIRRRSSAGRALHS